MPLNSPRMFTSLLVLTLLVAGCASQKTLANLGVEYAKANQAAVDIVSLESKQTKRVRRLAAIIAYINNPSLTIVDNLNATQIPGSFINFVCAGADDFEITSAGLQFTSEYAKTVKAITTAPEDTIGGYISALSGLKGKDKALALPVIQKNQFEVCRKEVEKDLPPTGFTAVTGRQENPAAAIAAIQGIQGLIEAIQKLIKLGLKMATEAEQRAYLKSFIVENQTNYQRVLNEDLSSAELGRAFARRRHVAVAAPYYAFEAMMKLSPTTDRPEILRRALAIDQDLAEYDAIRGQREPAAVVAQFTQINQRLQDYVDGKVSLGDMVQFLSETASELTEAKKDYDDVASKAKALPAAFKGQ